MPAWLVLVLAALATARLVRLWMIDTVFDRPRTWLASHLPPVTLQLLLCHWCCGWWLSGLVVGWCAGLGLVPWHWQTFPVEWAAVATVVGLLGSPMGLGGSSGTLES